MTAATRYDELIDQLRDHRRARGSDDERDDAVVKEIFDEIEVLWDQMSCEEQERRNEEGWRSWPDLYDTRTA